MVGEFILPDNRIPVTVITGFLGSGKTTLLNRVLTEDHGLRIAVIENEFGEVDIDGSLVADQQNMGEDILMLNNGCLCCTVRSDLVDMLTKLAREKKGVFDHVLIETTGLANPAPIIQTFFMEQDLADNFKLDGVITVVDSKHVTPHLDEIKPDGMVNEALEQVAFADRIVLNKIDLVTDADLDDLRARLRSINTLAEIKSAVKANVEISYVMGVGGFDLEKVVDNVDSKLGVRPSRRRRVSTGTAMGPLRRMRTTPIATTTMGSASTRATMGTVTGPPRWRITPTARTTMGSASMTTATATSMRTCTTTRCLACPSWRRASWIWTV